jgi:hypothetical protein
MKDINVGYFWLEHTNNHAEHLIQNHIHNI